MSEDILSGAIRLLLGDSSEDPSMADPDDLPPQDRAVMTDVPKRIFIAFGEPVLYYEQIGDSFDDTDVVVRRKILCPELEVASALAVLGNYSELFTIIPAGYYGELVQVLARDSGVHLFSLSGEAGSHISDLTNLNGRKIHQRLLSAFNCAQNSFRWERGILSDRVPCWAHTCISSFVWSDNALSSWSKFMESAFNPKRTDPGDILVSLELRTKDCDVPFSDLWKFLTPFLNKLHLLVLSPDEALAAAKTTSLRNKELDGAESFWNTLAKDLRSKIGCHALVVIFVSDDASARMVFSVNNASACSPRLVLSPSALLGRLIHKLMHAPKGTSVSVESVMGDLAMSPKIEPNFVITEIDRETMVRESIPEDPW